MQPHSRKTHPHNVRMPATKRRSKSFLLRRFSERIRTGRHPRQRRVPTQDFEDALAARVANDTNHHLRRARRSDSRRCCVAFTVSVNMTFQCGPYSRSALNTFARIRDLGMSPGICGSTAGRITRTKSRSPLTVLSRRSSRDQILNVRRREGPSETWVTSWHLPFPSQQPRDR